MWIRSLGREDPLEEGMATHSNIFALLIPWTEAAWWANGPLGLKESARLKQHHTRKK